MTTPPTGDPHSPHWWLRPVTLEELRELQTTVRLAHERGVGFASVTMNRIEIALATLRQHMEPNTR